MTTTSGYSAAKAALKAAARDVSVEQYLAYQDSKARRARRADNRRKRNNTGGKS